MSHNSTGMPDHSNLDPRLVSSFPTVKTGPVWGRHNEKKKKDTVCVTVPFNIECAACHHRMNKVRLPLGARALAPSKRPLRVCAFAPLR